jgi:hypothetical protein
VGAASAAGFWWWRRCRQATDGSKSGGRSSFKFPAAKPASSSVPRGAGTSNKKNKARRKEEKARRAEKRQQ